MVRFRSGTFVSSHTPCLTCTPVALSPSSTRSIVCHAHIVCSEVLDASISHSSCRTSVSLAFSTAVTVSGVKSRWRGAEAQQSPSHISASCSSSALTGGSDPEPGPTTTPSPPLHPDRDSTGSSADTERIHTTTGTQVWYTIHRRDFTLLPFQQHGDI